MIRPKLRGVVGLVAGIVIGVVVVVLSYWLVNSGYLL